MINKIGYNTPSFQAKLYTHGPIESDPNFGLTKDEMRDLRRIAKSIGTDEDKIILSATNSKKASSDEAEYDVYERMANITMLVDGRILTRTFEQNKVSAAYDNEEYWGSSDVIDNQMKAERMFNSNFYKIAKYVMETLVKE